MLKVTIALLLNLYLITAFANSVYGGNVAVITSSSADAYRESLDGFKQSIQHRIVAEYNIKNDPERGRKALEKLQSKDNPNLLFTIGTPALQVASRKKTSLPAVYSMVFNPENIIGKEEKNITGVSMNVSPKEAIQLLKELNPKIRRVGVVFDPAKSGKLVIQAVSVARQQGVLLVTRQIRSAGNAIQAIDSLRGKVDALWIVPDETILSDQVFQHMLLFSYQNKVPVLGLSKKQTQMGALLSLSYKSSKDMGKQAGEIANKILRPGKKRSIPPASPRQVKLNINLRAARKLKVEVPNTILQRTDDAVQSPVYEEGDWWVYRVKWGNEKPQEYRITYKNGQFQGADPLFLSEYAPALASVYLKHPQIKSFDFPLVPGKQWEFRYSRDEFGIPPSDVYYSGNPIFFGGLVVAEVQVTDNLLRDLETSAGKFKVVQIRRSDQSPKVDIVYYYSPRAKSIVKLTADLPDAKTRGEVVDQIEIELINFGSESATVQANQFPQDHGWVFKVKTGDKANFETDNPVVQAPVYEERDWWIYRVKRGNHPPKEYRIIYKNGKFQGDDPLFVADTSPPLASVYLENHKMKNLAFPLVPGKQWEFHYQGGAFTKVRSYSGPYGDFGGSKHRFAEVKVIGPTADLVPTPAGNFKVIEVHRKEFSPSVQMVYYYSPRAKGVVKVQVELPDARAIGAAVDHIEMELIKYGSGKQVEKAPLAESKKPIEPKPISSLSKDGVIQAPVYEEGDWWVFEVKSGATALPIRIPAGKYKVQYRNGKFESDNPNFLVTNLDSPFVSVFFNDQQSKDFEFPLTPGKKWSFQYTGDGLVSTETRWRFVDVEVVKQVPQSVETRAGKYDVIEIRRRDRGSGTGRLELTYFYSPETKSVIKLTADVFNRPGDFYGHYEMELIEFGSQGTPVRQPVVRAPATDAVQ